MNAPNRMINSDFLSIRLPMWKHGRMLDVHSCDKQSHSEANVTTGINDNQNHGWDLFQSNAIDDTEGDENGSKQIHNCKTELRPWSHRLKCTKADGRGQDANNPTSKFEKCFQPTQKSPIVEMPFFVQLPRGRLNRMSNSNDAPLRLPSYSPLLGCCYRLLGRSLRSIATWFLATMECTRMLPQSQTRTTPVNENSKLNNFEITK